MRKSKLFSVCLISILFISTFGVGVASARRRNFSFINYSGRIVKYLYISQSGYDKWGYDILGNLTMLANGDSCGCWYNDNYRYFDVKVIFADGSDAIFVNHDFRRLRRLTLLNRGGTYTIRSN